ncbi:hypothetical protein TVAG_038680 [Trichomonas vaginalis G3]|uniref:DUF3447 domain-containing protein n=1 Tax=Trichomonas vaginalis (strain ATCC PRA-98 / G3) TaxID=412133 RepID=A2DY24_TRIV3|nr:protein ubiquitination [Trichomonas vaginalis G3]EAY14760.1 hypothetical protein TVAG_038680 [Trichomonas vaginalis G3]KAI5487869.1 protein ubiquitination [Trichomonas vaginalis G3]|eukprot:XP_001326983.1 hypothetical protein [Trichomonas vaginalis G3]
MLDSQVPSNENYTDFKNIKPMEIFNYPNQVSKIIWGINSNNILQISSQVMDFIKEIKIPIQMALYLIDVFSSIREKEIKLFEELYEMISNEFSCIIKPENVKLATLLYHKGFRFEEFKPPMTEEDIINIYSKESPLYYIAWDKVDELKNKFSNLNFDKKIDGKITPFDCAIKYGSELCFNYMKNLGADYTKESSNYAV